MRGDSGNIHGDKAEVLKGSEINGYDVFVQDAYKFNDKGEIVPSPDAPKKYAAKGVSYLLAKELCAAYAAKNAPGPLFRKAAFEAN